MPTAQVEGVEIQGGDRKAQKEEAIASASSAGSAPAECVVTDLRNSSRSPVAKPPAAAGERTTTSNVIPKGEQVLRLWATTTLTPAQIARQVGSPESSVSAFISIARKKRDPRADARVKASPTVMSPAPKVVAAPPAPPPPPRPTALSPGRPVLIPGRAEATQSAAPSPSPSRPTASSHIVALSEAGSKVIGPRGVWTANAGVVRMLALLNDGEFHSIDALTRIGEWSSPAMFQSRIGFIAEKLGDIGITFTHIRGQGCKIQVSR
jgi:hypothetical protein